MPRIFKRTWAVSKRNQTQASNSVFPSIKKSTQEAMEEGNGKSTLALANIAIALLFQRENYSTWFFWFFFSSITVSIFFFFDWRFRLTSIPSFRFLLFFAFQIITYFRHSYLAYLEYRDTPLSRKHNTKLNWLFFFQWGKGEKTHDVSTTIRRPRNFNSKNENLTPPPPSTLNSFPESEWLWFSDVFFSLSLQSVKKK